MEINSKFFNHYFFIAFTGSYLKTGKIPNRQRSASNDKINGDDASISKAAEVNETFHFIFECIYRFQSHTFSITGKIS